MNKTFEAFDSARSEYIEDLMDSHEANKPNGEVFSEKAYRTG